VVEKSWERKRENTGGDEEKEKEGEIKVRCRTQPSNERLTAPLPSFFPVLIYRRYPSTLRALVRARSRPQTVPHSRRTRTRTQTTARRKP